jgi:predicted nucleic acid-binding protein
MILDTNFLIDIDNDIPSALEKAREIDDAGYPRRVPRVVIFELWTAVGKGTQTEQNREKYERLLRGLPQVDLTSPIAKRAGEIEGKAQANDPNDSGIGAADAIIAATALVLDEPVVTDDRRDFVNRIQNDLGLDDLRVEAYT